MDRRPGPWSNTKPGTVAEDPPPSHRIPEKPPPGEVMKPDDLRKSKVVEITEEGQGA